MAKIEGIVSSAREAIGMLDFNLGCAAPKAASCPSTVTRLELVSSGFGRWLYHDCHVMVTTTRQRFLARI